MNTDRRTMTRRRSILPLLLVTAALAGCAAPGRAPSVAPTAPHVTVPDELLVRSAGTIRAIPLEEYVVGTTLAEISPVGETAAVAARLFEIQSVVARSYAVARIGRHRAEGFDVCDTTHCQLYEPARRRSSRFAPIAEAAASRTRGLVLTHGARVVEAVFHADCGGSTAAAETVWGGPPVPYLRALVDEVPDVAHRTWRVSATIDELRAALNDDPRTAVGGSLDAVEIVARDASGRAAGLGVRGERSFTVRGDVLRAVLNRRLGNAPLPSTRFNLTRDGRRYVFEGSGFGHGVGLCQRGAAARARRGDSPAEILGAYYLGVELIIAGSGAP